MVGAETSAGRAGVDAYATVPQGSVGERLQENCPGLTRRQSQSPEGSLADFHATTSWCTRAADIRRNPPKGPSPISTPETRRGKQSRSCVAIPRRVPRRFPRGQRAHDAKPWLGRNPPKGPSPISTHFQQLSERVDDFRSQSPEGSLADFHIMGVIVLLMVPPCRNPPKGPSPISTGSGARVTTGPAPCRNPPKGPSPISTRATQGLLSVDQVCRNPPKGPSPISTNRNGSR